jgi:hypothetical protein
MPARGWRLRPVAQIDQPSPVLFGHGGQDGLGDREGGADLVVEFAAEFVPGHVLERFDRVRGERVVYQHIDAGPGGPDLFDHGVDRGGLAHVGPHGHALAACGLDVGDDLLGGLVAVQVVDHHAHAAFGQQARGGRADSAAGHGHERDPAGCPGHEVTSPSVMSLSGRIAP